MDSLLKNFSEITDRLAGELSKNSYTDSNNNENSDVLLDKVPPKGDKYSLRPRASRKCLQVEEDVEAARKCKKSTKQKSAPLSKYRRKTANARERNRMREINQAFETLRSIIPHAQVQEISSANEKLTKITTLRLAMRYINALSAALNSSEKEENFHFDFDSCYDLNFLLESDGESLSLSEHSLMTSPDFQDSTLSPFELSNSFSTLLQTDFAERPLAPTDFQDFFFT